MTEAEFARLLDRVEKTGGDTERDLCREVRRLRAERDQSRDVVSIDRECRTAQVRWNGNPEETVRGSRG